MNIHPEVQQKAEWRTRLIVAIIERRFDDETLADMLEAGLDQANSDGLLDAAALCHRVADLVSDPNRRHVASTLAKSIMELDRMNRKIPGSGSFFKLTHYQIPSAIDGSPECDV